MCLPWGLPKVSDLKCLYQEQRYGMVDATLTEAMAQVHYKWRKASESASKSVNLD